MAARARVILLNPDGTGLGALRGTIASLGHELIEATDQTALLAAAAEAPSIAIVADGATPAEAAALLRPLGAATKTGTLLLVTRAAVSSARLFELRRLGVADVLARPLDDEAVDGAIARAAALGASRARFIAQGLCPPRQATPAPGGPPPAVLLEAIAGVEAGELTIPAMPPVLREIRAVLADPKKSIAEVGRLVERDANVAASVLRVANTTEFARNGRVTDISVAVSRIGLRRIIGFVETILLKHCFQPRNSGLQVTATAIWRHSVALGLAMRSLAAWAKPPGSLEPNGAYVIGLLADVGASLLIFLVDTHAPLLAPECWLPLVRDRHEALGTRVMAEWALAPAVGQVAASHHAVNRPPGASPHWPLAAVAMEIAETLLGTPDLTRRIERPSLGTARAADSLHLDAAAIRAAEDQTRRELDAILSALG